MAVSFHAAFDIQSGETPAAEAVAVALARPAVTLTYADAASRSLLLSRGLAVQMETLPARGMLADTGEEVPVPGLVALALPRTHPDFLPMLLAASRRCAPFVLLSTDLADKKRERERASFVFERLCPALLVTDDPERFGHTGPPAVTPARLEEAASAAPSSAAAPVEVGPQSLLCVMFTGGTHRMKVVRCTHAMVLHEREAYPDMVPLAGGHPVQGRSAEQPRVLGNASAYWPAATLGQLSVSLAYGGCFVITEATSPVDLQKVVVAEKVDVIGLVPDQLALLSNDPARELPWVRLVLAWAEKLPASVARRWAGHPRAQMRELLIATEYWLALSAEPHGSEPSTARLVRGARGVALVTGGDPQAEAEVAGVGEVGELCLAGAMISPGYIEAAMAVPGVEPLPPPFVTVRGERYLRTGDFVRVVPSGFVFLGRADMLTKEKGQWVDLSEVEGRLEALDVVGEVRILPDPVSLSDFHAFVSLKLPALPGASGEPPMAPEALRALRAALPRRVVLHIVPKLPRHVATGKVDFAELRRLLELGADRSWPLVPAPVRRPGQPDTATPESLAARELLRARLLGKAWRQALWTASLLAVGVGGHLPPGGRWSCWRAILSVPMGAVSVAYMHLAAIHASESSRAATALFSEVPGGRFGLAAMLLLARPQSRAAKGAVLCWTLAGASLAYRRRRLLSWIVAFWVGAGHQVDFECSWWLAAPAWRNFAGWQLRRLWHVLCAPAALLARVLPWSAREPPAGVSEPPPVSAAASAGAGGEEAVDEAGEACDNQEEAYGGEEVAGSSGEEVGGGGEAGGSEEAGSSGEAGHDHGGSGGWGGRWSRRSYENWWWYNCTVDAVRLAPEEVQQATAALHPRVDLSMSCCAASGGLGCGGGVAGSAGEPRSAEEARLLGLIEQADPLLRPCALDTPLLGMDSLRASILQGLLRSATGVTVSVGAVREASTPKDLLERLRHEEAQHPDLGPDPLGDPSVLSEPTEHQVWWSPGQNRPMGAWVLRSEALVDHGALLAATQWLIDRHPATRASHADPIALMSFSYDAAVLTSLYQPLLPAWVRRIVSPSLCRSWPKVRVRRRQEVYPDGQGQTPLEVVEVEGGQDSLERAIRNRQWDFQSRPPFDVALFEMRLSLLGIWEVSGGGIVEISRSEAAEGEGHAPVLHYHDRRYGHGGRLLGPGEGWPPPPYGFPALYGVRLDEGRGVVWLRREGGPTSASFGSRMRVRRHTGRGLGPTERQAFSRSDLITRVWLVYACNTM